MVKTEDRESIGSWARLKQEKTIYRIFSDLPQIPAEPHIRSCHEIVGDWSSQEAKTLNEFPCMILEWMDTELWNVPTDQVRSSPELVRAVAHSGLSACVVFEENLKGTHTGEISFLYSQSELTKLC